MLKCLPDFKTLNFKTIRAVEMAREMSGRFSSGISMFCGSFVVKAIVQSFDSNPDCSMNYFFDLNCSTSSLRQRQSCKKWKTENELWRALEKRSSWFAVCKCQKTLCDFRIGSHWPRLGASTKLLYRKRSE